LGFRLGAVMTQTDKSRDIFPDIHRSATIAAEGRGNLIHWLWAVAVILIAGVAQAVGHLNADDSWFLTFAEHYVEWQQQPYVDISDPNPPAAFLVYVPAVFFARFFGIESECAVVLLMGLGTLLALFVAARVVRGAGLLPRAEWPWAVVFTLYACLVVPAFCFAEREHIALVALLPFAAVLAARACERRVAPFLAVVAGLGAGLAATFKPYYLLPLGLAVIAAAWPQPRRLLHFWRELAAASLVVVIYLVVVLMAFPAYEEMFRLALDLYAPVRDRLSTLLASPLVIANAALLAVYVYLAWRNRAGGAARVCAALSCGFLATFLVQGKGWNNHALPGIVFGFLALAFELRIFAPVTTHAGALRTSLVFALLGMAPILFGAAQLLSNGEEHPGLTAAVARLAPPQPRIAAIAEQLDYGHPLVRHLGGAWVGTQNCLWISWGAKYLDRAGDADPMVLTHHGRWIASDLTTFAKDIASGVPDIILIESEDLETWARRQPALASVFSVYVLAAKVGEIEIWQPRPR
jgi:hypothetical protein